MRQLSLLSALGVEDRCGKQDGLEVFDLFCGAGGFSTGAAAAGCKIAFACDSDKEAVNTHRLNHPDAAHWTCKLPRDDLPFPTDGRKFHLHGSPPCQRFSTASGGKGSTEHALGEAKGLIEWYLGTALASGASSWSMEQVSSPAVVEIVERFRRANRSQLDWAVFHFDALGVPQTRSRLLAGSPELIARLRRLQKASPRRSVRDVVRVCRGTHLRNSKCWTKSKRTGPEAKIVYTKASPEDFCFPVEVASPTILAHRELTWVTFVNGKAKRRSSMKPREAAALQTFPRRYRLPVDRQAAQRLVGNAVPPLVARLLMGGSNELPE